MYWEIILWILWRDQIRSGVSKWPGKRHVWYYYSFTCNYMYNYNHYDDITHLRMLRYINTVQRSMLQYKRCNAAYIHRYNYASTWICIRFWDFLYCYIYTMKLFLQALLVYVSEDVNFMSFWASVYFFFRCGLRDNQIR